MTVAAAKPEPPVAFINVPARRIKRNYSLDLFDTKPFAELIFIAHETAERYVPQLAE